MRQPLFGLYVKLYDCNMEESMVEDLKQFPTFSDFFKRKLRPDARTINEESAVVSIWHMTNSILHLSHALKKITV